MSASPIHDPGGPEPELEPGGETGAVYLTRIDGESNQQRYYRLLVSPDLFGGWGLLCEWGRIGASLNHRLSLFGSEAEARRALVALTRKKLRSGYRVDASGEVPDGVRSCGPDDACLQRNNGKASGRARTT